MILLSISIFISEPLKYIHLSETVVYSNMKYNLSNRNLDCIWSSIVSSASSDASDVFSLMVTATGPFEFEGVLLKPKMASKLPKQKSSFSASGTWRWFGIMTCLSSEMWDSFSFFSSSSSYESRLVGDAEETIVGVWASTGTTTTSTLIDLWLWEIGFGFHSMLGPTVGNHKQVYH